MHAGMLCTVAIALVLMGYVIADRRNGSVPGRIALGGLVGLNAGLNAFLLTWLTCWPFGLLAAAVNVLAALPFFSRNRIYQGLLGWMNWVLPMSWLVTGVGLVFAWIDLVVYAMWGRGAARIHSITIDRRTCTISIEGGIVVPLRSLGFNMGNFTFLRPGCQAVIPHETGHALNLAAFGAIFHYIGAIDENVPPFRRRAHAYAEHLAESHRTAADIPLPLRMWG